MMKNYQKIFVAIAFCTTLSPIISAQSGGAFEITQSVVSNGGGQSDGGSFGLTGTTGQSLAGTNSSGGAFVVRGGFWQSSFAPSAALVSVSGQVLQANGGGISRARINLTAPKGTTRTAISSSFGYFRFDDVEVGQTYILTVVSKRYLFINNTQVITVFDEIGELNFTAEPQ